jgi:F-type H+-transporting ATPase subunit delta
MTRTQRIRRLSQELFRLCLVNGALDPDRVRALARRVLGSGTRDRFKVLARFLRLVRVGAARHTATAESAEPLPPAVRDRIRTGLERVYGQGLTLTFTESPELIGGVRVRVGSDVYDGSVRGRLSALAGRF